VVQHAFGSSHPLTLGLEEELLLVDPETHRLAHVAERVLDALDLPEELAAHEAFAAEIELRSPVCRNATEAAQALAGARAAARAAEATLMAAGLHPAGEWGDVRLTDAERYRVLDDTMRSLIRRTPECALHVHVGAPDPEGAIRILNGLRPHLPLLQGLAANSPWWFGADSGLASARFSIVRAYPRRGVPRAFSSWDEYAETVRATGLAGEFDDYTRIWWDARAHPRLGTVELREIDVQSSVEDCAALAALVQGLAARALEAPIADGLPSEAIAESSFRASRDGVDATILQDGSLRPLPEVARETVELVAGHARELGSEDALGGIERILDDGGGAGRQRAAVARGGVEELLSQLVRDTAESPWPI
jgi:carboxylate-amine ligase